jgi:FKBP-type peptidyl-prolyl cis-trans isomerase
MNITATAVAVTLAVVVAVAFLFFGPNVLLPFQSTTPAPAGSDQQLMATTSDASNTNGEQASGSAQQLPGGLMVTDEVVGTGAEAKAGDTVTVNYVGQLTDGKVFDASANHGQPFSFTLGVGQVIKGWDEGVAGMKVGGKRKLVIPPALGYGSQAVGNVIPANSTLVFEVELVSVGK